MSETNSSNRKKYRADELLVENGLCADLKEAARFILAGQVRIGKDHLVKKASEKYTSDVVFELENKSPYVSRGAYKLMPALDKYLPSMDGLLALDIGASTGGFTDLMLQRGASKVYTVDSGRGQLHQKLRNDPRVVCHEKVNARYMETGFIPEKVDAITMDVSFISVTSVLPAANGFLKDSGIAFILIKPQFEAGRENVGKGGVVRDESVINACIEKVKAFASAQLRWENLDVISSPIKGPKGNQEYMAVFKKHVGK